MTQSEQPNSDIALSKSSKSSGQSFVRKKEILNEAAINEWLCASFYECVLNIELFHSVKSLHSLTFELLSKPFKYFCYFFYFDSLTKCLNLWYSLDLAYETCHGTLENEEFHYVL